MLSVTHAINSTYYPRESVLEALAATDVDGKYLKLIKARPGMVNQMDLNAQNCQGTTALMMAAKDNNFGAIELLCNQAEVNLNATNNLGRTALMIAASHGHDNVAIYLAHRERVDVNVRSPLDGASVLHIATSRGRHNVVKELLKRRDIEVNKQDVLGWSALMSASFEGHEEIVSTLLSSPRIDVNLPNKAGVSASMMAAMRGHVQVLSVLTAAGGPAVSSNWFPSGNRDKLCAKLVDLAIERYVSCRGIVESPKWQEKLPKTLIARTLAMAFGHELILTGKSRGNLLAIERLLSHSQLPE